LRILGGLPSVWDGITLASLGAMKPTIEERIMRTLENLRALRDEIRLNIHLAGMDAKSSWSKLEDEIEKAERRATAAGRKGAAELADYIEKLRERAQQYKKRLERPEDRTGP
jgi:hypothetical protein